MSPAVVEATKSLAAERRVKILLVDDTPENLVSLEAALAGLGEELVLAGSGKEALHHLLNDDCTAICWTSACRTWTGSRRRS